MTKYYLKYIKYKNKYLLLKGGSVKSNNKVISINENNKIPWENITDLQESITNIKTILNLECTTHFLIKKKKKKKNKN